jgi:hypothetical protein
MYGCEVERGLTQTRRKDGWSAAARFSESAARPVTVGTSHRHCDVVRKHTRIERTHHASPLHAHPLTCRVWAL